MISLSHYHLCFCPVMWNQVLSVVLKTCELHHCFHISISITPPQPITVPASMSASIFSLADSPHPCPLTTRAVWVTFDVIYNICHFIHCLLLCILFTNVYFELCYVIKVVKITNGSSLTTQIAFLHL